MTYLGYNTMGSSHKNKARLLFLPISILMIFLCLFSISSCDIFSPSKDKGPNFPQTPKEIQQATQRAKEISHKADSLVNDAIQQAYETDGKVDPSNIAGKIEKMKGIESVKTNDDGSMITYKQQDGLYVNVPLIIANDDRMFSDKTPKKAKINNRRRIISVSISKNKKNIYPDGNRALILAPFERNRSFKHLSQIQKRLKSAGFDVDYFANEDANLDRFRGNFLKQYDVIIIYTHGGVGRTISNVKSTILATGEKVNDERNKSLKNEGLWVTQDRVEIEAPIAFLGGWIPNKAGPYYSITVPWLKATTSGKFDNTYIFADACQSSKIDEGPASLSQEFFKLGAGGYNGFDASIYINLMNIAVEQLTDYLSSGVSLNESTNAVRSNLGLANYDLTLRLVFEVPEANINLLDNSQRISDEPFFIFDPDRVVGTAKVSPSTGFPGTDVVYEVRIRDQFADQVDRIEFYIDNTDELIEINQVTSTLWRRDDLSAPAAEEYPRVDTFTFTAYDAGENIIGTGAATFTIQEPENGTSRETRSSYEGQTILK